MSPDMMTTRCDGFSGRSCADRARGRPKLPDKSYAALRHTRVGGCPIPLARGNPMCKTLKLKVRFNAPPEAIYEMLADTRMRTAVTGRRADISKKVGGAFSTDAGRVTGINVDL